LEVDDSSCREKDGRPYFKAPLSLKNRRPPRIHQTLPRKRNNPIAAAPFAGEENKEIQPFRLKKAAQHGPEVIQKKRKIHKRGSPAEFPLKGEVDSPAGNGREQEERVKTTRRKKNSPARPWFGFKTANKEKHFPPRRKVQRHR